MGKRWYKMSEETFSTLLQRIQRQYNSSSSSSSSRRVILQCTLRPPDEAAYVLGTSVARSFLDLIKSSSISSNSSVLSSSLALPISNQIQEDTFIFLTTSNREFNPALSQGFFDALLDELNNNDSKCINLEGFFSACIYFTEQKYLDNDADHCDDENDVMFDPLTCQIRAYAKYTRSVLDDYETKINNNNGNNEFPAVEEQPLCCRSITRIYSRLKTQAGRMVMLREFTSTAFLGLKPNHHASNIYRYMLTPLLVCCVLSSKKGDNDSSTTAMFCIEGIWREIYSLIDEISAINVNDNIYNRENQNEEEDIYTNELASLRSSSHVWHIIVWLKQILNLYLLSIPAREKHTRIACKELSHRWLATLLDLGVMISQPFLMAVDTGYIEPSTQRHQQQEILLDWFEGIISQIYSWFALITSYRFSLREFWLPLRKLMTVYASYRPLNLECTLKLATIAMCHPIKQDVKEILHLFAIAIDEMATTAKFQIHPITISIIEGLGSIFLRDPLCAASSKNLLNILTRIEKTQVRSGGSIGSGMIQLFNDEESMDEILHYLSDDDDLIDSNSNFSALQQAGLIVLFAFGILNDTRYRKAAFTVLKKILLVYPHLGISVLPLIVDSINSAAVRGEGDIMIEHMEFLTEVLTHDSQCAREIWNLLGKDLMQKCIPTKIRSSIIRLYPKICKSNEKLYQRIIESMGNATSIIDNTADRTDDKYLEINLAIAATTADLARDSKISDPTDVIVWLQNFISDDTGWIRSISKHYLEEVKGKSALIHYSILALHYLVVSEELDFELVLVVLGKRLCSIHKIEEVSSLPPLVLEALVLLLGDGEDGDESDEDENRLSAVGVSRQVSRSIETLICLWSHRCLQLEPGTDPIINTTIFNCKRNVLHSLTKYSFEALGIDEENVQDIFGTTQSNAEQGDEVRKDQIKSRYHDLKQLISDGFEVLNNHESFFSGKCPELSEGVPNDYSCSLLAFTSKILKLEEDALGSSLWQKRRSIKPESSKKKMVQNTAFLPTPKSVLNGYNKNPCQATSLAVLLSFKYDENSIALLSDLAIDAISESSDPLLQTLYVQSWLNAARNMLREMIPTILTSKPLLEVLFRSIREWRSENPDSAYILLSSIALLIPTILGPYGDYSSYIADISNDVWEAYHSHLFEDPDVAKLCIGFVGVCDVKTLCTTDRLVDIVNCLEKSVSGFGGLPSFGAYFALAGISQACVSTSEEKSTQDQNDSNDFGMVERILIFLLDELSKCIKGIRQIADILVYSIKTKTIKPDDINALNALTNKRLKVTDSKKSTATSIFISLGICLPTITSIYKPLLLHCVSFLECIEWGCGKGLSLRPVLHACCVTGLLGKKETNEKFDKYSKDLQDCIGLDEIMYVMTSIQPKATTYLMQERITGLGRDSDTAIKDEEKKKMALVSAVSSVSSIPCLGQGTHMSITDSPCLVEVTKDYITCVGSFVSNGSDHLERNSIRVILCGFLASFSIENNEKYHSTHADINRLDSFHATQIPEVRIDTGLNIVLANLQGCMLNCNNLQNDPNVGFTILLGVLEDLSLPAQFSTFLLQTLSRASDLMKVACIKLLVSQIKGRPRAVFDGREFVNSALQISKMPTIKIRDVLGEKEAAEVFVDSFAEYICKIPTSEVDQVTKNVYSFCTSLLDQNYMLIVIFFRSTKRLLRKAANGKSSRFSPKSEQFIKQFVQQEAFAGICSLSITKNMCYNRISDIIIAFVDCFIELPKALIFESKYFDGHFDSFHEECFRIRVVMTLIRKNYSILSSRAAREITSSLAWISQQLTSNDDMEWLGILQTACAVAEASCAAIIVDKKKDLILSFLDNLVMVDSVASFKGLEILAVLLHHDKYRSDTDSSLTRVLGTPRKWLNLSPHSLKKVFKLMVNDLPISLAKFTRREKLSDGMFNSLKSVFIKWQEQESDESALMPLRVSLICCRNTNDLRNIEDIVKLVCSSASK